ncbi:MAG: P1 family peptidase [Ardenticatenaceae bacterium]|nr:P1 family peptidase [Anaerolineales bacterium]MCB8941995.1 P1 family peptidase [Ardenticatenaceae bacterium]MCB8973108.1 P1 family peptidase [Ardenticatenaceae bacterium]
MQQRLRDLGITIGQFPTGEFNAITDIPGVTVGHCTVIHDKPRIARTGVTMVLPRGGDIWHNYAFAGYHSFNGNGEMTGIPWLKESGMLGSPIGLTNTHQVGIVRDALVERSVQLGYTQSFLLPVVAETYDGWLNDINAFHVTKEHAIAALDAAQGGAVAEGNVGGGTGMICHDFKGGIGTSSRVVEMVDGRFTIGVLVQANYGDRALLRVDGVPVGQLIPNEHTPVPFNKIPSPSSSIIIIVGTDAPLLPTQCDRLAQRATVGLARVGGTGYNGSGDIFLAFSTGNHLPAQGNKFLRDIQMVPNSHMNDLFNATAEAVEEAILNALCAAETMIGFHGHTVHALPQDRLQEIMGAYRQTREAVKSDK